MKNKQNFIIVFLFISLVVGVICYLVTSNYIYALSISFIYILYGIFIGGDLIKRYQQKIKKSKECYSFINNYVISLSSKNSHIDAFNSASIGAKEELLKEIEHMSDLSPIDKIKTLSDYFQSNVYQMFLNIIESHIDDGGDILSMSKLLLSELTKIETNQIEFERKGKGKVIEFIILWILTFIILVLIRFSLNQFYLEMSKSLFYTVGLLVFFILALVSIHILIKGYTNEKIKLFKVKQ